MSVWKSCSESLVMRKFQITITVKYYDIATSMLNLKNLTTPGGVEDVR